MLAIAPVWDPYGYFRVKEGGIAGIPGIDGPVKAGLGGGDAVVGSALQGDSAASLLLTGSTGSQRGTPPAALPAALFRGALENSACILLVMRDGLYLEELLLHKIWSPDLWGCFLRCPERLQANRKKKKDRKRSLALLLGLKEKALVAWFGFSFNTRSRRHKSLIMWVLLLEGCRLALPCLQPGCVPAPRGTQGQGHDG